mmetsp:Transcript_10650/g.22126  ORF Transcript_10650/g.22126 Transcript_10650/m.22126 type:complete len:90 (+) Transcript_10650:1-270(+)
MYIYIYIYIHELILQIIVATGIHPSSKGIRSQGGTKQQYTNKRSTNPWPHMISTPQQIAIDDNPRTYGRIWGGAIYSTIQKQEMESNSQ